MTMTVAPPVVQPSPGLMAFMQGVAAGRRERSQVRGGPQGGAGGGLGLRAAGAEPGVLTFGGVQAARPAAVLGVVVHKHVVRHGQHVSVHAHGRGHHHLRGEPRPVWLEPWGAGRLPGGNS